jgi:hypothetical protein
MKWSEIRAQHPDKFILLSDIVEKKVSDNAVKIMEGTVLKVSDEAKEIRALYQVYKKQGLNVIYALPSTPQEFVVENVPFMGILR